jgi:hypothetical protein
MASSPTFSGGFSCRFTAAVLSGGNTTLGTMQMMRHKLSALADIVNGAGYFFTKY